MENGPEIVIADTNCVKKKVLQLKPNTVLTFGSEVSLGGEHLIISSVRDPDSPDARYFATPRKRAQADLLIAQLVPMRIRKRLTEVVALEPLLD